MTLLLAAVSGETIWLLTDRRISYPPPRPPNDAGVKAMRLETTDGVALLGYAGLGATPKGTEPSTWMSAVLRGHSRPLEETLGVLTTAAGREIPPHLATIGGGHNILIPALLSDNRQRLFTIRPAPMTGDGVKRFELVDLRRSDGISHSITTGFGGSGGHFLGKHVGTWSRPLRTLLTANEQGRASDESVARRLAHLNTWTSKHVATVGPRCIVMWARLDGAGGGSAGFVEDQLDFINPPTNLPSLFRGLDFAAAKEGFVRRILQAQASGMTLDEVEAQITNWAKEDTSATPSGPDERLL